MVHQNCLRFYNDIAYDRVFNGLVMEENEGARLARELAGKRILFHSNHGARPYAPCSCSCSSPPSSREDLGALKGEL